MTPISPQTAVSSRDGAGLSPWTFLSPGPEMLLAVRQRGHGFAADLVCLRPGAVQLAGDLATFAAADLFVTLHTLRKSGLLIVSGATAERAFLFLGGNLAWASSSHPEERRNPALCRLELHERAAQLLGRAGDAPARAEVAEQVCAVLRGLLQETQGSFALSVVPLPPLPPEAALDTQELLLTCLCGLKESNRQA